MEEYIIHPIKVGEFKGIEKSNLTYQTDPGTKIVAPIIIYLIKGRDRLVLVDTGCSDEEWARQHHHGLVRTKEMHPLVGLRKCGVEAKDIDLVVNTHLHWDHCFNNELFPNAKIYVQKKELAYAVAPLPYHKVFYESHHYNLNPRWFKNYNQIVAIDGDFNLLPGVDLITLPGHTPGFQGVLVNTKAGRIMIASDCCGLFENWSGGQLDKHIPSGIHYRLDDYFTTFQKMEKLCTLILPGHDPKVFENPVLIPDAVIITQ